MNKNALITGASSGIGLELAHIFAQNKTDLVLVARSEKALKELASLLENKHNIKAHVLALDLSIADSAQLVYNFTQMHQLRIDYLINNAGFGDFAMFAESKWDKQAQMINLNILALTHLTHLYLPDMIKRKNGRIMNVASTASFQPGPTMSVYYASKAFVLHFSEAIANELEGTGVSVTALCPGPTASGFQDAADLNESKLVKGRKLPDAKSVAEYAFKSMMKGKVVAIHGLMNTIMATGIRFTPRSWVVKMARKLQDK